MRATALFACFLLAAPPTRGEKEKEIFKTKAFLASLTPDGKTLAASGNGNVRLVDVAAKKSKLLSKAQAPIVLQIRGVERTKERLTAFVNAAVPDFG